jgi:hypothetical protein
MTLPLAIRPRIRLREEPEPTRSARVPPIALPVVAYWMVMGFLTYGVSRAPSILSSDDASNEHLTLGNETVVPAAPPVRAAGEGSAPVRTELPRSARPLSAPLSLELAPSQPETPPISEPSRMPTVRTKRERAPELPEEHHTRDDLRRSRASRRSSEDAGDDALPRSSPEDTPVRLSRDDMVFRSSRDDTFSRGARDDVAPQASRAALTPASTVSSCESVLAAASDEMDLTAARGVPDLSRDAYAAILENGAYLSACSIPDGTALEICAAVREGRAIGVTVVTRPSDARVRACVRGVVASLAFPSNPRLDVTRTRFDAVRTRRTR